MNEHLKSVREFHETFKAPILNSPSIPNSDRANLRISLLKEELNELSDAIEDNDIVEVLDAFCDIQYVLSGAILEFGMQDIFDEAFNEVHRSNMSKKCKDILEANKTSDFYYNKDGTTSHLEESSDGGFIVYRDGDDKVLKSVGYSAAELEKFLHKS